MSDPNHPDPQHTELTAKVAEILSPHLNGDQVARLAPRIAWALILTAQECELKASFNAMTGDTSSAADDALETGLIALSRDS